MTKNRKYIIMPILLALLSVATSCEQEELPPVVPDSDVVEVTATIGEAPDTRVSQPQDNVYTFDNKDKIHIVGWYGYEGWDKDLSNFNADPDVSWGLYNWWNDAVSTNNATSDKWKTEPYMRWQNGDEDLMHHFIAWCPEDFVKSTDNFTSIPIEITGDAEKDDILLAHWTGKRPDDNTLRLQFKHLMSRFDVHLFFRSEYTTFSNISIETNLRNKAVCDFLTGDVTSTSGEGIKMQARQHPDRNYHWSGTCITVPHEFNGPLLTLKFTTPDGEKTITYTHPENLVFNSGERTTLYLYVGKNEAKLITTGNGYPGGWSESETELN